MDTLQNIITSRRWIARQWYEKETAKQTWSVITLQRNISSQYYYRLLRSQVKQPVIEEKKEKI